MSVLCKSVWSHSLLPVLHQAQLLLPVCLQQQNSSLIQHYSQHIAPAWQQIQHAELSSMAAGSSYAPTLSTKLTQQPCSSAVRGLSSHPQQQQQQSLYVLPMPSLSHAMQSGRITKWLKTPGDLVSIYDIIAEVTTDSLVEEAYKVDDFAGSVTLLLESQEEAYLAAVLVPEGQEVQIGFPVAVLCEDDSGISAAADAAQQLKGLNVYDEAAMQQQEGRGLSLQLLEWQSYLKESGKDASSSCGCM